MPAGLRVIFAVNIASIIAILLVAVAIGGGFIFGAFLSDEGHEIKLIPIQPDVPAISRANGQSMQRAEIPAEYRTPDPSPSPWIALPDGSVRFVRND